MDKEIIERRCTNMDVLNYVLVLADIKNKNKAKKRLKIVKKAQMIKKMSGQSLKQHSCEGRERLLTIHEDDMEN